MRARFLVAAEHQEVSGVHTILRQGDHELARHARGDCDLYGASGRKTPGSAGYCLSGAGFHAYQLFQRRSALFQPGDGYAGPVERLLSPHQCHVRVARRLWRDGFRYAKAGVVFVGLCRTEQATTQFFPSRDPARSAALMQALDAVNRRYGRDTLRPGDTGQRPDCLMRRAKLSPAYTTCFKELLPVSA